MERQFKMILVSACFRGKTSWQLVAARKVGNHYQISSESYEEITKRSGAGYGQTLTIG